MTVALDASMLILLFDEKAAAPIDLTTGAQVTHCKERIQHFLNSYGRPRGARIVIPTPALAEFLVRTKPEIVPELLGQLQRIRGVEIVPFAIKAAIEFSEMQRVILTTRGKRAKGETETRAKAKFDQQIVAIAKSEGASTIYSDDHGLASYATRFKLAVIGIADLPLSPDSAQASLPLEPPEGKPSPESDE